MAPQTTTSAATPVVAAAAAVLVETGHSNPGLSDGPSTTNRNNSDPIYNAERSEVIKAVLMAGADRFTINGSGVANISDYRVDAANQTANGLDARFGAGQVNVYNSYHIIAAGEQNSNEDDGSGTGNIGVYGFDYDPSFGGSSGSNNIASYYFSTGADPIILSTSLVWNMDIAGGGGPNFNSTATFYDLDLLLYDVTGSQTLVMSSASQIDNTENIWTSLQAGRDYLLQVIPKAGQSNFQWDYALAWQIATDTDGDGISDTQDNCPDTSNTDQADMDGDTIGDACDSDIDGDGTPNGADAFPYDPAEDTDTDSDGIGNNADTDDDNDGLLDTEEVALGTDPLIADTDGDGLSDFDEVNMDGDPTTYTPGIDTDPHNPDTDGDGYGDGEEVTFGSDPLDNTSLPIAANGDLNNDGIVNVVDVMIGQQILNGQVIPTIEQLHYGDVAPLVGGIPASDGLFNAGDLVVIQRKATGLISF